MSDKWDKIKSWLTGGDHVRTISAQEADVLSTNRRRGAIKVLSNTEKDTFPLTELAEEVSTLEHGKEFTKKEYKSVYSTLHSTHLESMANIDIIEIKQNPYYRVRKKPKLNELDQYVEDKPSNESLFKGLPENSNDVFTANQGFSALKNPRRRFIIRYLDEVESTSMEDLYTKLTISENSDESDDVDNQNLKKSYVSIKQNHIPFLEEIDVVTYDKKSNVIQEKVNLQHLSKYLPKNY